MKIGKIKSQQTFDNTTGVRVFSGTDIQADYLDPKGAVRELSFHYAYATNNYKGLIESVLSRLQSDKDLPAEITNVKIV